MGRAGPDGATNCAVIAGPHGPALNPSSCEIVHRDLCEAAVQARRPALRLRKLVADESTDLFAAIPHGDGQTILREALLVAAHNSYHIGEMVLVRRLLGAWPER